MILDGVKVGSVVVSKKLKKNMVGMRPKQVAEVLMSDDVENILCLCEEGRTSEGFEFNTITIYSRKK